MRNSLALVFALVAGGGCDGGTGPDGADAVALHVVHAAPTLGEVAVGLDESSLGAVRPFADLLAEVAPGSYTLFVTAGTVSPSATVEVEARVKYAVVLMDALDPRLEVYPHPRSSGPRLTVLSAVPGPTLAVELRGPGGATASTSLAFAESSRMGVDADRIDVLVAVDDGPEVPLGEVAPGAEPLFLVIAPGTGEGELVLMVL